MQFPAQHVHTCSVLLLSQRSIKLVECIQSKLFNTPPIPCIASVKEHRCRRLRRRLARRSNICTVTIKMVCLLTACSQREVKRTEKMRRKNILRGISFSLRCRTRQTTHSTSWTHSKYISSRANIQSVKQWQQHIQTNWIKDGNWFSTAGFTLIVINLIMNEFLPAFFHWILSVEEQNVLKKHIAPTNRLPNTSSAVANKDMNLNKRNRMHFIHFHAVGCAFFVALCHIPSCSGRKWPRWSSCGKMDMWLRRLASMRVNGNLKAKMLQPLSIGKHQAHFSEECANCWFFFLRKMQLLSVFFALKETYRKAISTQFLLTLLTLLKRSSFCFSSLSEFYLWFSISFQFQ